MDATPGTPQRPIAFEAAGPAGLRELVLTDDPSSAAVPVVRRTPAPALSATRRPWDEGVRVVVSGAAVMVIVEELGRRAGASGRLTALCSAGAGAVVVGPWLVPRLARRTTSARALLPGAC